MADLRRVEQEGLIPGATFMEDSVSNELVGRNAFHCASLALFAATDLVFFDPDNVLEVPSGKKGQRNSSKFVFLDELNDHYAQGRSVLVYQHFPHEVRVNLSDASLIEYEAICPIQEFGPLRRRMWFSSWQRNRAMLRRSPR